MLLLLKPMGHIQKAGAGSFRYVECRMQLGSWASDPGTVVRRLPTVLNRFDNAGRRPFNISVIPAADL